MADPTSKPTGILGVVLDINKKPVTVNSGTITEIKTKGINLGITNPVDLGTFQEMIGYINGKFKTKIPTDPTGLPDPLPAIIKKVEDLDVTIQKAHIFLPGTESKVKEKQYTLVMSVLESGDADIVSIGPIGLKGAVIGVTNVPDDSGDDSGGGDSGGGDSGGGG